MYTMLLLAFFAGSSLTALADGGATTWTGDGDGWRWEDPDNWEYDHIPTQYDSVVISGDAYVQITEPDAECATVTIFQDATLFVRSEGSLNIYGYFFDTAPETSGIGYYYPPHGINADDYATIVNWGTINIGSEYYYPSPETSSNGYYEPSIADGINLDDDTRMLNRGELNIEYVGDDGIEMDEDALFVNRDFVSLYYIGDEGIDMDEYAIVRNRGQIDISYVNYQGIDQDDDYTEFINSGELNISFTDDEEGIELDDGLFKNTETGVVNIAYVANDLLYIRSGSDFENYGVVNLNVVPFDPIDFPEIPASAPESPDTDEDTPDVVSVEEFTTYGAILITGGDLHNYSEINISPLQFFGSPETPAEAPYYFTFASLLNEGGDLYNEDCASINIDGPFPIINEAYLYNEGTIDLSIGDIPISPEEGPGPMFGEHINEGYFYNDGDILSDYPFSIGPNPIDELWTKSSIGDEGENDNFSLGCDITITTSSRQGHKATTDNVAFLNQTLCGDRILTARIDGISNGAAGIMIRDGEGGGEGPAATPAQSSPKMFMIASRNVDVIYHGTRYNEGGQLSYTPFFTPHDRWLRVERIGNYIRAYHSSDGNAWSLFHQVYLELDGCAQIGLFATSQNGAPAMASFSNVAFSEPEQNFSVPDVPTAEAPAIQQRATVWPTPVQSQFTVEFEQATQVAGIAILRNELGQAIGQRKLEPGTWQLQWDANTLPGGLYLLEVQTEDGYREVLKVLKQ